MSNQITNQKPNFDLVIFENGEVSLSFNADRKNETILATQEQIAELFGSSRTNVLEHITNIYKEGELLENETLSKVGNSDNSFTKPKNYYNLDVIIAVGYRVNSKKATQFRRLATNVLKNYFISGYVLDEKVLENDPAKFEILLQKIREIRTSEKMFYEKVKDVFAITSVDYEKGSEQAAQFFAWVQNKFHYAITGETAAEIVVHRLSSQKENAGLTTFKGKNPTTEEANFYWKV